jgi:hypothetical protein
MTEWGGIPCNDGGVTVCFSQWYKRYSVWQVYKFEKFHTMTKKGLRWRSEVDRFHINNRCRLIVFIVRHFLQSVHAMAFPSLQALHDNPSFFAIASLPFFPSLRATNGSVAIQKNKLSYYIQNNKNL